MGDDVTNFVNGTVGVPQLLNGTVMDAGDTLYTLPYNNTSGIANVEAAVTMLDTKLNSTSGEILVFGYSEGCQIADLWLTNQGASTPISPSDLSFLLIANANRKYGGFCYNHSIFNNVAYTAGKPADTAYSVIDFARQYDGVADFPTAAAVQNALVEVQSVVTSINAFPAALQAVAAVLAVTQYADAAMNALAGFVLIHNIYLYVSVADTANVSLVEGNITWVWSPTYPVPLLGVGSTYPQADFNLRTQIEKAYSRPVTIPLPKQDSAFATAQSTPVTTPFAAWFAEISTNLTGPPMTAAAALTVPSRAPAMEATAALLLPT